MKKDVDDAIRETVAEQRSWQLRMRDERDEAAARAEDLRVRVQELTESLERVRCTSKAGLLEQLAGLQNKVKELSSRRTLQQKRVKEANLDLRRASVAQENARRLEAAFQESFMEEESADQGRRQIALLEGQLAALQARLSSETEARKRYQSIAEPSMEYFFHKGSYSLEHDLAGLECITTCHVSAGRVSMLFFIFARFFRIKLPCYTRKVRGKHAGEGSVTSVERQLFRIGGKSHFKELSAIAGEAHRFQLGEWLLQDADANFCYIADGANSLQQEMMAHLLSRRDQSSGKIESMAVGVDAIHDKSAENQAACYRQAMRAAAEAMCELSDLGLLEPELTAKLLIDQAPSSMSGTSSRDGTQDDSPAENAAAFFEQRRKRMQTMLKKKVAELVPTSSMNDRASTARKAARLVLGGDGKGGDGDVPNGATCGHHCVANVGEDGRKEIDWILRHDMQITDEQAESDASKIKALRTSVGWFSSPACSLIYQVSKYVALFSSKGYAIGENFAQWLAHKMRLNEQLAGDLIGHVEDLLAICGGRDYIFFLDAAVVDRFSQLQSLHGYLLEEADLGAEAGGKLRKAILTGFSSVHCMAAVRSMAIIADAWLWPVLRAIEPGDDAHILDVCPELWPRVLEWLQEAAAKPCTVIDGTLCLRTRLMAGGLRTTPREQLSSNALLRSKRSAIDMQRIQNAISASDETKTLVHRMLTAAFTGMAKSLRNHAAEFLGDGRFTKAKITPELRAIMSGTPVTSVMAETLFARIKRRADRGGISRHDTRIGAVLCERDGTVEWLRNKGEGERVWRLARRRWRKGSGSRTMQAERALKGEAKAPEREAKLENKRGGRAKRAAEIERIKCITIADKYSLLKSLHNDELADQLKYYKLVEGLKGFKATGNRAELVATLQLRIFEKFGAAANDLADGDSGVDKESDGRRRRRRLDGGGGKNCKKRKRVNIVSLHGWEWEADEEFEIERYVPTFQLCSTYPRILGLSMPYTRVASG